MVEIGPHIKQIPQNYKYLLSLKYVLVRLKYCLKNLML